MGHWFFSIVSVTIFPSLRNIFETYVMGMRTRVRVGSMCGDIVSMNSSNTQSPATEEDMQ